MKGYMKLMLGVFVTFILILSVTISCKPAKAVSTEIPNDTIFVENIRIDTVKVTDYRMVDSLATCLSEARDSIRLYRDSIPYQDYINARRIEKIKYYIRICEKRSTNKKFFYGWIKRTMAE